MLFRHNGTCVPINSSVTVTNGAKFTCECVDGYNGVHCELSVDLCRNITCKNKGICQTIGSTWKCFCLDSTLYFGDYCQFRTNKLKIREFLSKSFAYVAITAITGTFMFVLVMDILKYIFHIDDTDHMPVFISNYHVYSCFMQNQQQELLPVRSPFFLCHRYYRPLDSHRRQHFPLQYSSNKNIAIFILYGCLGAVLCVASCCS